MLPPKPKSAPAGRVKSKRSTLMKEVNEWVLSDTDFARETSRHSGTLTENVTEERMLRTKLLDLGIERFKSLHKHNADIQSFVDGQKKKFAAFRRNRVSSSYSDRSKTSSGYSTAHSILSKNESANRDELSAPMKGSFLALIRPKIVQFDTNMQNSAEYLTTGIGEVRPHTVSVPNEGRRPHHFGKMTSSPLGMNSQWSRPSTGSASRATSSVSIGLSSIRSDSSRHGFVKRSVNDPRFVNFEKALSLNYVSRSKVDVRTIIERIEALRRRPVKAGSLNTEEQTLEEKIRLFMQERGISFD